MVCRKEVTRPCGRTLADRPLHSWPAVSKTHEALAEPALIKARRPNALALGVRALTDRAVPARGASFAELQSAAPRADVLWGFDVSNLTNSAMASEEREQTAGSTAPEEELVLSLLRARNRMAVPALAADGARGHGPPLVVGKQHGLYVVDVGDGEHRPVSTLLV